MKLNDVLNGVDYKRNKDQNPEVLGITDRAQEAKPNSLFVAVRGYQTDGHALVCEATRRGASAVVVERLLDNLDPNVVQVVVKNTRQVLGTIASNFFGEPSKKMKMIGITGTNGKTSTAFMIKHICEQNKIACGVIGTSGAIWGENEVQTGMTTPDPVQLQSVLAQMANDGTEVCAMEVSAHALDLFKTSGIVFDAAIFSNLTQDHLDYFGCMQKYGAAKVRLFKAQNSKFGVVCTDDEFGKNLASTIQIPLATFGKNEVADFCIAGIETTQKGQNFVVTNKQSTFCATLPLYGEFNAKNALGAVLACSQIGVEMSNAFGALATLPQIDGRFNGYNLPSGALAIVDYAHTPDGVQNVLAACQKLANARRGRLVALFGCGGNRDKTKRPQMGKIAEQIADFVFVTSDNSRFEEPDKIICDIKSGMQKQNHVCITDRTAAIEKACEIVGKNDVLAVLGKGAETYLDICGTKVPYSDVGVLKDIIARQKGE